MLNDSNLPVVSPRDASTPAFLLPTMGEVGPQEPVYYRSLFLVDSVVSDAGEARELDGPLDPYALEDDGAAEPSLKPAFGVLTVHEQVWTQTGLGLGNLLQSICLAPGEVTQIAVTRWERRTVGSSTEDVDQSDSVSNQAEQHRAVTEVQQAVAKEAQLGGSSAISTSASAQAGAAFLFGSASGSTNTSTALTAQFSSGSRSLEADSTTAIAQSTAEKSQALRSRRQSVVREVSEQEAETLSTRVLANYNRRHTMNILFFEVLQKYSIETRLKHWDRCIFVPLVPLNLKDPAVIKKYQVKLLDIFSDFGATEMIGYLTRVLDEEKTVEGKLSGLEAHMQLLQKAKQLASDYFGLKSEYDRVLSDINRRFPNGGRTTHAEIQRFKSQVAEAVKTELDPIGERQRAVWAEFDGLRNQWSDLPPIGRSLQTLQSAIDDCTRQMAEVRMPATELIDRHRLFLNQQLWLRMSPYRIYRMLKDYQIKGRPLSGLVDPQPVGVFGNYLAFRWGFENSDAGDKERQDFANKYLTGGTKQEPRTVGLPTSGVFAEAVLGQGLAAERIDPSFADWGDKNNQIPILPPKIADLQSRDRAKGMDLKAQDLATSLAELRAKELSDVSHIDKILSQVGKGDMFRDMGGLAQAVSLADKMATLSNQGATDAGNRAVQLQTKVLDAFEKIIESDAGQAAVAEFMMPGSGRALLNRGNKVEPKKEDKATPNKVEKAEPKKT